MSLAELQRKPSQNFAEYNTFTNYPPIDSISDVNNSNMRFEIGYNQHTQQQQRGSNYQQKAKKWHFNGLILFKVNWLC